MAQSIDHLTKLSLRAVPRHLGDQADNTRHYFS
jgi:hypothetical protein